MGNAIEVTLDLYIILFLDMLYVALAPNFNHYLMDFPRHSLQYFAYSLLYGAEDPLITAMVLDSAFTNLYGLMMELVDVYKIRLPKFTVRASSVKHFSPLRKNIMGYASSKKECCNGAVL